jgi:hypothetical protein
MDFEPKFDFLKIHKKLNVGPLCIIDLVYGRHDQEIQRFIHFLRQTDFFGKTNG